MLSKVPREIRDIIYEYLCKEGQCVTVNHPNPKCLQTKISTLLQDRLLLSEMTVMKQAGMEFAQVFFRRNAFRICNYFRVQEFLRD